MAFPFLTVLRWARRLLVLFPLPEWTNVEATRLWAKDTVLKLADEMAGETSTELDDKLVDALKIIVADAETWTVFYTLIVDLVGEQDAGLPRLMADARVIGVAEKAGIDFSVFANLILRILELIEWFRKMF